MPTRALIGIENPDGTVTAIYCHYDGYPEGVGATLKRSYRSELKIRKLLDLGSIATLGDGVELSMGTDAYYRDHGEHEPTNLKYASVDSYKKRYKKSWADYAYLFSGGKWSVFYSYY